MKLIIVLFLLAFSSCSRESVAEFQFAKGADISWATEMEKSGVKFYNKAGVERDCFALMKEIGMNSIRLRVWVDPKDGWCNKEDLVLKARRAKALGMRLMIDFHYSDWWADPGKQNKPADWENLDFEELKVAVAEHTREVLNALKKEGITPEWVQVGNETGDGMLWEEGRASKNMANYAQLNNSGYNAVKQVFPNARVIVHIHNGFDKNLFNWIFDGLKKNGGKWDVIGMSLYPEPNNWLSLNEQCINNINELVAKYATPVIISEVGMSWDKPAECKSFLLDLMSKAKGIPNNKCLGVFYWEPQCYKNWNGYTKGAFDNSGKPTEALDAFYKIL